MMITGSPGANPAFVADNDADPAVIDADESIDESVTLPPLEPTPPDPLPSPNHHLTVSSDLNCVCPMLYVLPYDKTLAGVYAITDDGQKVDDYFVRFCISWGECRGDGVWE